MAHSEVMLSEAEQRFGDNLLESSLVNGQLTLVIAPDSLLDVCEVLKSDPVFGFEQLIDLCGVDYGAYGVEGEAHGNPGLRLAVVYHLLSVSNNHRLRLRLFVDDNEPVVKSVVGIWRVADWFEREAFDLFGIVFEGHTDLRRILTDYGFIGHPFRKDFPLTGRVEMRYDPDKGRVVYQPVTIEPRTLVPRIIREEPR